MHSDLRGHLGFKPGLQMSVGSCSPNAPFSNVGKRVPNGKDSIKGYNLGTSTYPGTLAQNRLAQYNNTLSD